ncbi:MAG: hypothetical protein MUP66_01295 [Candidatus Nanohaloarchaeota archaeon QJJ-5]|nr:hypothetical protein [Candidatus Nanohaloarchaeota archaeon QJJ-5]
MSLPAREIIENGYDRAMTRAGWLLIAAYVVVYFLNNVAIQSMAKFETFGGATYADLGARTGLGLLPSLSMSYVVFVISMAGLITVVIVALRVFLDDHRETIPREAYTALRSDFVRMTGGLLITVTAVAAGTVALFIPGIYFMIALYFFPVFIVERDCSIIDSLRLSSHLVEGYKWDLLKLGVTFIGVATVYVIGAYILGEILRLFWAAGFEVVFGLAVSVVGVWIWGSTVETYEVLHERKGDLEIEG